MCGIAGFYGEFPESILSKMADCMAHRGPDDQGSLCFSFANKRVGLSHRRLSIIDLSSEGHQPISCRCPRCNTAESTPEESLWLSYNGEIYNYRELQADLVAKGHRFHSKTDSEVILHLYAEYGLSMLSMLNGIYAFALYDGRKNRTDTALERGELLLVRDGLGVKPLYYAETTRGVLFASELKSLIATSMVDRELDPVAIDQYITYLWAPAPSTPVRGVKKCHPGEAMIVNSGQIIRRWQHYDIPYDNNTRKLDDENEIAARVEKTLLHAVEKQLVADVPVGAFLSGGLDSSAVVAMMRYLRPDVPIQCYSIGFGDQNIENSSNDLPYATKVADHLKVDLKVINVHADMIKHLGRMIYYMDEPQADPAPINALLIAEHARRDGIKVLMSGAGGDDIFSGYRRHQVFMLEKAWQWLPQYLRLLLQSKAYRLQSGLAPEGFVNRSLLRRYARMFSYAGQDSDVRLISYFFWNTERLRRGLYAPEFAQGIEYGSAMKPLLKSLDRVDKIDDQLNKMLYLESKHFLGDHNLNYTDKMGMAAGIEVRVPLLDPDLVSLATQIPSDMKQKGSIGKAIFKKSMEQHLPRDVIYRPKTGFGAPLRYWLKHELRDSVDALLSRDVIQKRGIFDPSGVASLIEADRAGRVDGAYTIFALLCIEIWCQIFLDGVNYADLPASLSS